MESEPTEAMSAENEIVETTVPETTTESNDVSSAGPAPDDTEVAAAAATANGPVDEVGLLLSLLFKPEFHYADFHRNFPAGKVADTNHDSRGYKPSRHVEMFATKSVTSLRQTRLFRSNGILSATVHGESWRQSLRHSPRTLSQSRRNGIWTLLCSWQGAGNRPVILHFACR